ncbi:maleylpyruvate isomerase family mycothiol-dependent enzyme [Kribbella turkmenica]|uniref:Maleylpyruvate isomerase family mycothiol-dependent enzyme n=1 Tax=Kribbella turkmenica TaxID=2530375 RepID=A0A4R4X8Z1_9ACTN|nr:maleylpyruvate isomerase family mycothiol-dependent enzyme [Kribbella turkmenica]TDD26912.1 maleylpyruvate isomerase family mycothiol-dependent enzyme [Kribbella turkmenica]
MIRLMRWIAEGTALSREALVDLDAPSLLPGWSRKHVAAHLALNAAALGNLVHWARTGDARPMYASTEQRNLDIEVGARRPAAELLTWFDESARALAEAMATLTEEQWQARVLTAQGDEVPATAIPWMRGREVMIHAVDLGTGVTFADLPEDFLEELCTDIRTRRGDVPELRGPLAEIAAYLAGRAYESVTTADGSPARPLPPWL